MGLSEQVEFAFELSKENRDKYAFYPEYVRGEDEQSFPDFIKKGKKVKLQNSEREISRDALDRYIKNNNIEKVDKTYSLEEILEAGKTVVMNNRKMH